MEGSSASAVFELVLFAVAVVVAVARWWRTAPGGSGTVDPVTMVSKWLWFVHPEDEAMLPELRRKVRACVRACVSLVRHDGPPLSLLDVCTLSLWFITRSRSA